MMKVQPNNMITPYLKVALLGLVSCIYVACKNDSLEGNKLAEEYCNCMEKNHADKDYYNARVICDSRAILKNRYFKMYYIEALYGRYMGTFDQKVKDSVYKFNNSFGNYIGEHCPYVYKADSIRDDYLKRHK